MHANYQMSVQAGDTVHMELDKMRMIPFVAAFGLVVGLPALSTSFAPAAYAQAASEQQAVQAQLIALAQAGDWNGFQTLVNAKVAAGQSAMLGTIAGNMADMGLAIADSDTPNAVALELAAMALVDNPAINSNADNGLASKIGTAAGQVKAKIARRNPAGAAALASAAARNSASGLMVAYNQGQVTTQSTGSTNPVVVVVRQNPPRPDSPEVPVIVEPNPDQTGSPT